MKNSEITGINWPGFVDLKALKNWFRRTWIFWTGLGVALTIPLIVHWTRLFAGGTLVGELQVSGLLLEAAGVFSVGFGLVKKIQAYGGDSLLTRFVEGFSSAPFLRRHVILRTEPIHQTVIMHDADIQLRMERPENPSTYELLNYLDRELANLKMATRAGFIRGDQKREIMRAELHARIDDLTSDAQDRASMTKSAHTEDVGIEVAGLVWVIVGLVLATIPEMMAPYFAWWQSLLTIVEVS